MVNLFVRDAGPQLGVLKNMQVIHPFLTYHFYV
jgi:hypothetical protein